VTRIVSALEEAVGQADVPDGLPPVQASFAWAVAPDDGATGDALLDCADQRLLYRKRLNKTRA
jgi:hypothetical protein